MMARLLPAVLSMLAACPSTPPPLPAAVDLRPQFEALQLPPRGQGGRPTCSVFVVTAALEWALARATGRGERLSVEYLNWAANAATGRGDDGDFFHGALAGFDRYGVCPEAAMPYSAAFAAGAVPSPDALVAAGLLLARARGLLQVRWLRPLEPGSRGLSPSQFAEVRRTLADGWPVAAGSSHSRLLVGYRDDAGRPGGGVFLALDSAAGGWTEVDYEFVRTHLNDAFAVATEGP
jgi:hypothetical protein